jgi:hypothetical protein
MIPQPFKAITMTPPSSDYHPNDVVILNAVKDPRICRCLFHVSPLQRQHEDLNWKEY